MSILSRVLISVVTLVFGLAVLFLVVIIPTISNMKSLSQAIEEERLRIEKTTSGALGLRNTASNFQKVKEALPQLLEFFVKPGREIELFTLLEEKGRKSEITERLRLGELQAAKHSLSALPLEIELRGKLDSTLEFLDELQTATLLLPLENIELRASPAMGEGQRELLSILKATAYVHN